MTDVMTVLTTEVKPRNSPSQQLYKEGGGNLSSLP